MVTMVGIDYQRMSITMREKFVLTREARKEVANCVIHNYPMAGCIILSTCNRTEFWFSEIACSPIECFLSSILGKEYDSSLEEDCVVRAGEEAVLYCMELGCGLHSQIFGEDQILAQLKQALEESREFESTDPILETLFRTAITAAKEVKSKVILTDKENSLPRAIIHKLSKEVGMLTNKCCLVIGNGIMGRMMAEELSKGGCYVTMTLRQYKKNEAVIPKGCDVILYEHRYEELKKCEFVFSATKSQHLTIKKEEAERYLCKDKTYYMIDLAVPRDLDPKLSEVSNVTLYDMDYFGISPSCKEETVREVREILKKHCEDYFDWCSNRNWSYTVDEISDIASFITDAKLTKVYKSMDLALEERNQLQENIKNAAKKAVSKIIFELKDVLPKEQCQELIEGLEKAAKNCV